MKGSAAAPVTKRRRFKQTPNNESYAATSYKNGRSANSEGTFWFQQSLATRTVEGDRYVLVAARRTATPAPNAYSLAKEGEK